MAAELEEFSVKVVPLPSVKTFLGVEQQSKPRPSSQQNCPSDGSPHGNTAPVSPTALRVSNQASSTVVICYVLETYYSDKCSGKKLL